MKVKKLMVGVVSLFALTACGSTDPAKFKEEFSKIEEHTYSSATIKYSYESNLLGKSKGSGTVDYKFENGKWTTNSNDEKASTYMSYLMPVKDAATAISSIDTEGYDSKVEVRYYTNPLKIKATYKETAEENGVKSTVKLEAIEQFDKYGYITVSSLDLSVEAKKDGTVTESYIKYDIKISYKD